jgi:hypothetical protein
VQHIGLPNRIQDRGMEMKLTKRKDWLIGPQRFRREVFQIAFAKDENDQDERVVWDHYTHPDKIVLERMYNNDVVLWCILAFLCGTTTDGRLSSIHRIAVCIDPVMEGEGFVLSISLLDDILSDILRRLGMLLARQQRGRKGLISVFAFFEAEIGRLDLRVYPHRLSEFYIAIKKLWQKCGKEKPMTVNDLFEEVNHLLAPETFEEPVKFMVRVIP